MKGSEQGGLTDEQYQQLLRLRAGLRRFLHWSEEQAEAHGLTPAQHQLLLAVRGSGAERSPTIGELAELLALRHHSVVGLVDRAEHAGLVMRKRDPSRHSVVHVCLTDAGARLLRGLSQVHLREIAQLAPAMQVLLNAVAAGDSIAARESPDRGMSAGAVAASRE